MRMSKALYQQLKADCQTVVSVTRPMGLQTTPSVADMWGLFHRIRFDRMNNSDHPNYQRGDLFRILPMWENEKGELPPMQGNDNWLNQFYIREDLNDSHIETALKQIAKELR